MKNYWLDKNREKIRGASCSLLIIDDNSQCPEWDGPGECPKWDFHTALEETIREKYGPNWTLVSIE